MTHIHLQNNKVNTEAELTLGDVINFIFNGKWFALVGIVFGAGAALSYLAMAPNVYESNVTIQIQPTNYFPGNNTVTISSEDLIERFKFSKTAQEISLLINLPSNDNSYLTLLETLRSAQISKAGTFLTLTIKTDSLTSSEELAQKITDASIDYIYQKHIFKLKYLERFYIKKQELISTLNSEVKIVDSTITTLSIEDFLSSPELLKPFIVDGPSIKKIAPKKNSILLLGSLLGLGLGLLFFYLKNKFFKK